MSAARRSCTGIAIVQQEWDVVVWGGAPAGSEASPPLGAIDGPLVLAFVDVAARGILDGQDWDQQVGPGVSMPRGWRVGVAEVPRCTMFPPPDSDDAQLDKLVRETLLPVAADRASYTVFAGREWPSSSRLVWSPLAWGDDRGTLAARYHLVARHNQADAVYHRVILVPADVKRSGDWVRWVFTTWRRELPLRFAGLRVWSDGPAWWTSAEEVATAALEAHEHRAAKVVAELEAERVALESTLADAVAAAEHGARRLLTAQGDELVDAVADALRLVGFAIEYRDDTDDAAGVGRRLEDLRVTDPDDPDWVALVEVRGYRGGARVADFGRIERFATEYALANGRRPSRLWYVANHSINLDPDQRDIILHNEDATVAAQASEGVAAIDSRSLFQLVRTRGDADDVAKSALRVELRECIGRWPSFPSPKSRRDSRPVRRQPRHARPRRGPRQR